MDNLKIKVAFRFNVNFSRMEKSLNIKKHALEKDLNVISHIVRVLNVYNAKDCPVSGTWVCDSEKLQSKDIMPEFSEVIEKIKLRAENGDEIEFTSPNNTMITMLNNVECELLMKKMAVESNNLKGIVPVFRPSENMMSPSIIPHLKKHGMAAISLYYSNSPYTAFSNFTKPLTVEKRFRPTYYSNSTTDEKIALITAVNAGDIMSSGGINMYLRKIRKFQTAMKKPKDLLVVIDMNAEDKFWYGYFSRRGTSENLSKMTYGGLYKMIEKCEKLSYVEFTTPYEFLKNNPAENEIAIPFDLANGSFEGYSSWTEKWENTQLFSKIEKARYNNYIYKTFGGSDPEVNENFAKSSAICVDGLNSQYFGITAPLVQIDRYKKGRNVAINSLASSLKLLKTIKTVDKNTINLAVDNPYYYMSEGVTGLVKIDRKGRSANKYVLNGKVLSSFKFPDEEVDGVLLKDVGGKVLLEMLPVDDIIPKRESNRFIENENMKITINPNGSVTISYKNEDFLKRSFRPEIRHRGRLYHGEIENFSTYNFGNAKVLKIFGTLELSKSSKTKYEYTFTIIDGVLGIYFDGIIEYPKTECKKCSKIIADKLGNTYDGRYEEVMPFELCLTMKGKDEKPFKIIKQNFFGDQIVADIDIGKTTKNRNLDSFNNSITAGYIAVSNGEKGLLIAESVEKDYNFAFCPMRVTHSFSEYSLKLNPFGTYSGKQYKNVLTRSMLSSKLAVRYGKHFKSLAPSFNGKKTEVSMVLMPFFGNAPSDEMLRSAYLTAYPPINLNI